MPKKGYKHPEDCEHCRLSRERKGELNPFYGKKHKEETIRKLEKVNKDYMKGNQYGVRGHTEEEKLKQSEMMKLVHQNNPELALTQSKIMKGNTNTLGWEPSEEWKQKQSDAKKKYWAALTLEERQEKILLSLQNEVSRDKRSKSMMNNTKFSDWWVVLDEETKDEFLKQLRHYRALRPTRLEEILRCFLTRAYDYDLLVTEFYVKPYFLDIAIPELKLNFEADGNWSHRVKENMVEYEFIRDSYLTDLGWTVFRFEEDDLNIIAKELGIKLPKNI